MKKIFYPCSLCYDEDCCKHTAGCARWKAWFRAYWAQLRARYAPDHD
uniref:Jingzhaotoxin-XI motif, neurotoxin spider, TOXIN n=1 Tax=Siphoviridae sp. ct5co22 TaxID=2826294 RepID=A0A8S5QUF7_9CAUD|nr:MAG TPA: Jingzhaotoxin-XI motif, neurotoxin spider, TOXIN [Siphoviridae sp. ct5co22]